MTDEAVCSEAEIRNELDEEVAALGEDRPEPKKNNKTKQKHREYDHSVRSH